MPILHRRQHTDASPSRFTGGGPTRQIRGARWAVVAAVAALSLSLSEGSALATSAAPQPATVQPLTVNVPPAIAGESYTQQIGFQSFVPGSEAMTAISGLPDGVSLSPMGVLSADQTVGVGSYTIQAGLTPAPAAAPTGVIDIAFTVVAPGSSIADLMQGKPSSDSLQALVTPLVAPTLGGRIACSGYAGCNTSTSTFGGDAIGHPMTQWSETGQNMGSGCDDGNYPVWMTNNAGGAQMGVYIDDSIDGNHSFTHREALISCAWNTGQQVIIVGMHTDETGQVLDQPNGEQAGQILDFYPYCNGLPAPPSTGGLYSLSQMSSLGFVTQQYYVPPGCSSGASQQNHTDEWNAAWKELNGTYDYTINSLGRQIWSPWGDLLASY